MFEHLDIYDRRERALVGLADAALAVAGAPLRLLRRPRSGAQPRRVLLLRLERIGDVLMTLGAIRAVRARAPHAAIDLVVGSWNADVAALVPGIDRVEILDVPWLARGGEGASAHRLAARALRWRRQHYDLAINFEGDIRSHLLVAGSLARRRVGFDMAGGGPLLTDRVRHDPRRHTALNALALVERAFDLVPGSLPGPFDAAGAPLWRLEVPLAAHAHARAVLEPDARLAGQAPLVGIHVAGGRAIKQWPVERFADVATALARHTGARILFTGGPADRAQVAEAISRLPADVVANDAAVGALPLPVVGAILASCQLVVTGDTGPMHLAAAVGTPVVGVFGPSDPARYGPLSPRARVVRIDLPCSPCNRIRRPPARCVGHTPDCLDGVTVAHVVDAALDLLAAPRPVVVRRS